MMDVGLADRLRYWLAPAGFQVVEVDGWQTRGRTYAAYAPRGSLQHHTAGALAGGDAPSLGICINGRPDLPGPLCEVFGSRSLVAYVVAAGVANHAGGGGWNGLSGNQTAGGMEMEHSGGPDEPRTERLMEFCARVQCALITAPGSPADPANSCQHFEWSDEGKIDFYQWPGADLRSRIAALLASGPGVPQLPPAPSGLVQAHWYYKNAASGGPADGDFGFGDPGDIPLVGDWDGDGVDGVGVRRGNSFYLADSLGGPAEHVFTYGDPGDHVLVGDWDGDGKAGIGVVRGNVFYLRDSLTSGNADHVFAFGNPGDGIVVGRWRPGQRDSIGVHRDNMLYLRNPDSGVADIVFAYGDPGDRIIVGDWDGDGVDTPAVVRAGRFLARNSNTAGNDDVSFAFGNPADLPFASRYTSSGPDGVTVAR